MILKQKKKLLYALSFVFGLVLTVFAVQKDQSDKHELVDSFKVPYASADTPPVITGDTITGDTITGDTATGDFIQSADGDDADDDDGGSGV